tara:strand:- start:930 stop:1085 length:156 start_codon:yes stop_codon:yes gene_type:complete
MSPVDDIKVLASAGLGIGNWMLQIDILLKVAISVATLVYIILKIVHLLKKR